MDGNGALFGTLQGNTRDVLHKFTVDLPKKHGRGGQSALRFARLRMEKRHNYVRKVAETAVTLFLSNDKANVSGLILAGSADFKTELSQSDMFDQRLQAKIIKLVDVSYGGENGFNQVNDQRGWTDWLAQYCNPETLIPPRHWISHLCKINHFSSHEPSRTVCFFWKHHGKLDKLFNEGLGSLQVFIFLLSGN